MKKKKTQNLKLIKESVSRLEVKEIDKVKGGSGGPFTSCNTWFDCWLH